MKNNPPQPQNNTGKVQPLTSEQNTKPQANKHVVIITQHATDMESLESPAKVKQTANAVFIHQKYGKNTKNIKQPVHTMNLNLHRNTNQKTNSFTQSKRINLVSREERQGKRRTLWLSNLKTTDTITSYRMPSLDNRSPKADFKSMATLQSQKSFKRNRGTSSFIRVQEQGQTKSGKSLIKAGLLNYPVYRKKNVTANFQILRKNGAKFVPAKLYSPKPFHFSLDRKKKLTTKPTKASTTEISNSKKKKCKGSAYKPTLQPTSRVVPSQTGFIEKGPDSKQLNKAPMQKPIIKPTKKMVPQILAGCSMEAERIEASKSPTQTSKVQQTLFIPKVPLPKKTGNCGGNYKTKQTYHIKQNNDIGRARHIADKRRTLESDQNYAVPKVDKATGKQKEIKWTKTKHYSKNNKGNSERRVYFPLAVKEIEMNGKATSRNHLQLVDKNSKFHRVSVRHFKARKRRQLMVPYGLANEPQINPFAQQLAASLPAQPFLSEQQNILGQMLAGQSEQALLSQPSLLDKQTLYSPFLQQQGELC
jgi:hypothetical protein